MSAATTASAPTAPQARFTGGGTWLAVGGGLGVLGLLGTAILYFTATSDAQKRVVLAGYLIAVAYWLGIAIAATIWQSIFHAAKARWVTVIRRSLENMAAVIPLFVLLILPIALGMNKLFDWANPPASFSAEQMALLAHKHPYLNPGFFWIRIAIYFAVWIGVSGLLRSWSLKQDEDGNPDRLEKMRTLGPASLPFLGLTMTFAGFDWLMSLDPFWSSTIFGAYYFAGSFLAAMAVLTVITVTARVPGQFGQLITTHHLHNLGKFLLAFTAFWTYIGFSQFMLIWIANLPEEGEWYISRMKGGWLNVSLFLVVFHFAIPFFTLLSRSLKFKFGAMRFVAAYLLLVHLVDIYWMVMPAIHQPHPDVMSALYTVVAFVGVGGLSVAFAVWRARGNYSIPVKDPYLTEALRYTQP